MNQESIHPMTPEEFQARRQASQEEYWKQALKEGLPLV
jgi:hypothetical protein